MKKVANFSIFKINIKLLLSNLVFKNINFIYLKIFLFKHVFNCLNLLNIQHLNNRPEIIFSIVICNIEKARQKRRALRGY